MAERRVTVVKDTTISIKTERKVVEIQKEDSSLSRTKSAGRAFDLETIAAGANGSLVLSTERACRVTATIFDARDLRKKANGPDARDPVFKVKVEKTSHRSSEITGGVDEDGVVKINQRFTFHVKDLRVFVVAKGAKPGLSTVWHRRDLVRHFEQSAILSVHVVARGMLGMEESLGCIENISVADLLEETGGRNNVAAKWVDLFSKDTSRRMPGKVYLHVVAGIADPEQKISMFVGTWNVGNARPPGDLSKWIPRNPDYEIVAIGTQECDYQPRHPHSECGKDWSHTVSSHLGDRYKLVHGTSRGQMRLLVFVREDAEKAISDVDSGSEATGVGHVMANKGAVCIGFKFWDTGLCFVNSHFAAHPGQCEARNHNYREIAGQLRVGLQSMDILNQYHHVFWFGDLNYRLDFSAINEKPLTPQRSFWEEIVRKIDSKDYADLLQYDELRREYNAKRVLYGFKEGKISFAPTFKMQRDVVNEYHQKRMPAWCDRIFWRNLPGCTIKLNKYFSAPEVVTSDHKPVAATFQLTSHALPSSVTLSSLHEEDDKRWHVQFTSLRAKRLRASDINGFSDPYVSFVGPNLIHEFHSKVKHQTLNPVWNPMQELPTLVLNMFPLERLEREYLLVRVLDRDYTSTDDTLGYATIPLAEAVAKFKKGPMETAHFKVDLTHRGLPKGTLEGSMRLTWERNLSRRGASRANAIIVKTLSFKETFKKRVLMVRA